MAKFLIIEDQEGPFKFFVELLGQRCGVSREDIDRARWYTEAEEKLRSGNYDIVMVDHRMPYSDPGCTDEDLDKFSPQCDQIGYGLIPLIRRTQPGATMIGTSTMHQNDRRGFEQPELTVSKLEMFQKLEGVINPLLEQLAKV